MKTTNPLRGLAAAVLFANLRAADDQLAHSSWIELKDRGIKPCVIEPTNPLCKLGTAELRQLQRDGKTQLIRWAAHREEERLHKEQDFAKLRPLPLCNATVTSIPFPTAPRIPQVSQEQAHKQTLGESRAS